MIRFQSSKLKVQSSKLAFGLWILTFLIIFYGCASIDDLSSLSYRDSGLKEASLASTRVGLLPMFGKGENRGHLKNADDIFAFSLSSEKKEIEFLSPEESLEKIESAGLIDTYQGIVRDYSPTAMPRLSDMSVIGGAIGTKYIVQSELQSSRVTEGATHVRIHARLWDTEKGIIVWEGIGEARGYVFLIFPVIPSSFEKTMEVASRGLARRFP